MSLDDYEQPASGCFGVLLGLIVALGIWIVTVYLLLSAV